MPRGYNSGGGGGWKNRRMAPGPGSKMTPEDKLSLRNHWNFMRILENIRTLQYLRNTAKHPDSPAKIDRGLSHWEKKRQEQLAPRRRRGKSQKKK